MTHVAIIGADGMLGRKLTRRLIADRRIGDRPISRLTLADIREPALPPTSLEVTTQVGDISQPAVAAAFAEVSPDIVFHVAATFMGQADSDFVAGYRINFFTVQAALEAIRQHAPSAAPRFVYASSIGVYGPPFPDLIPDDFLPRPDSSYGTQKLMSEAILNDYSRLGFIDGIALRLPTIAIRPGPPTHGNSGFFSNIVREPLAGREAILPAALDVRHWIASPRSAVGFLLHAANIDTAPLGHNRTLTMPGLSVTVSDEIEVLRQIGGDIAVSRITRDTTPFFTRKDFPQAFEAAGAREHGFVLAESDFSDIVRFYLDEISNSEA